VTIDEELSGGESRSHRIRLKARSILELSITRFGIDVSIRVIGPRDKIVVELDDPNGAYGPKRLLVVAEAAGIYRVDITAHDMEGSGRYRLRVPSIGRATPADRERLIAQGFFVDAARLARSTKEIAQEVVVEYEKARTGFENAGDKEGEAIVCFALGVAYYASAAKDKALEAYGQSKDLFKAAGDTEGEVSTLEPIAEIYRDNGKYADAEQLERRVNEVYTSTMPTSSLVASARANLAEICRLEGKYKEAETLNADVIDRMERTGEKETAKFAQVINNLAVLYYDEGRYDDAEKEYQRSLNMRKRLLGKEAPQVAESLNNLSAVYWKQGKYSVVEPMLQEALEIQIKAHGRDSPEVAENLVNLCQIAVTQADYTRAEPYCLESLEIYKKKLPPGHANLGMVLNAVAGVYRAEGKYALAEPAYKESVEILEKALGPAHFYTVEALSQLGSLYFTEGNYQEAAHIFQQALDRVAGAKDSNIPETLRLTNDLADTYKVQARYAQAEELYVKTIDAQEKALGPDNPTLAVMLFNLGALYDQQAKYAQAKNLLERASQILEKNPGPETPEVATACAGLAEIYYKLGDTAAAETKAKKSLKIRKKIQGEEHPDVAKSLNDLAAVYWHEGKWTEAEPLFEKALSIREKALPAQSPLIAQSLNNLAKLYQDQGKYTQAEPLYHKALKIRQASFSEQHPDTGNSLQNLAEFYFAGDHFEQADGYFDRALANLKVQFKNQFAYMNEKERLAYLDTVSYFFPLYFSFCNRYKGQHPDVVGKMLDVILWEKGMVVNSVSMLRARVAASGDSEALALFDQLAAKRTLIANQYNPLFHLVGQENLTVERLQKQSNDIEAALARRVGVIEQIQQLSNATWEDVKNKLSSEDVAVEVVRFPYSNGKKWTDRTYYAALIVTHESARPLLVVLGDAEKLEGSPLRQYRQAVGLEPATLPKGTQFYDAFWRPLENFLVGHRRVYLAPDGPLNEVVFDIVRTPRGGLLMDEYDVRILSSTQDLLHTPFLTAGFSALLLGDPRFDLTVSEQRDAVDKLGRLATPVDDMVSDIGPLALDSVSRTVKDCPDLPPGRNICPLKSTGIEVKNVYSILKQNHWQPAEPYVGEYALKEVLRRAKHPRLLHIATHGFFFPDGPSIVGRASGPILIDSSSVKHDPMLRSGLLFAGAERAWRKEPTPADLDDGVLTAYEASILDLQGTELVVLSACETGRGETRTGEGVFGLRRALREAGAASVLMSMWYVPNRETQELMTKFYQNWLSGTERHLAFRKAQLAERAIVRARCQRKACTLPEVYYWGAFVLVGP